MTVLFFAGLAILFFWYDDNIFCWYDGNIFEGMTRWLALLEQVEKENTAERQSADKLMGKDC